MRIALATEGTRGDVHPLIDLGERLVAQGHEVVLCATPDFRADAEARRMAFRPVGMDLRAFLEQHAAIATGGSRAALGTAYRWFRDSVDRQFDALPEATEGADLILGAGIQAGAASIAEARGVPYRYVAYCPILFPSADHAPMVIPRQDLSPRWNRVLWWLFQKANDRLLIGPLNRRRKELGLPPVRDTHRYLLGSRPVLAVDRLLADAPLDTPCDIEQIGCLHRIADEPLPEKLEGFLDAGPAPVYFGFGSMPDPDPASTTRVVLDAIADVGCRAIVSRGWAGLGDGPLPEGVLAIGPVAHARLFPRVAAVVHHGGAGTTAAAARAGTPQIIVPHLADQFYWGRRVQLLGLGPPPLPRPRLRAADLARALREVVGNEVLAERAKDIGERLRASHRPDADATRIVGGAVSGGC